MKKNIVKYFILLLLSFSVFSEANAEYINYRVDNYERIFPNIGDIFYSGALYSGFTNVFDGYGTHADISMMTGAITILQTKSGYLDNGVVIQYPGIGYGTYQTIDGERVLSDFGSAGSVSVIQDIFVGDKIFVKGKYFCSYSANIGYYHDSKTFIVGWNRDIPCYQGTDLNISTGYYFKPIQYYVGDEPPPPIIYPETCNSETNPSCFCSNTLIKSGTDFTYYPYTFTGADLVVTGFLGNSLEIRPPGYNFFTQPDLLAKFNFSNVDTDADLSGDFYPNSFFVGTGGTYDTTGLIDSFSESRLNFQTFYFGTGSSTYYYSTGVTVANSGTLAFDYVKIHGLNNDTVDLEYISIDEDFNGKEYGEVKRIYSVRTDEYIRLPRPTRSIKIILQPNLFYYIPKIEVGYYVPDTSFVEECIYISPEDIANINWLDGVGTSQALSDMVKSQIEQDSLNAFKFDNPILDGIYQKMVGLFVKIGLNNLVQLIKITVPQEPVEFINMPRLYISGALIGVEDSTLDIVVLENDYDVSGLLPESPYGPFFIGLICTVFWIVYLSIIVSVVFFGNSFLISFIDGIVTRFFGNSVLNSSGGNIFSLFTTASWLFFIGKALITILSFVNFIFPILTYGKNLLLGILTIVTLNLGGYTTFATLSNWILYTIATGVLVYSMMLAGKAYLKLN